MSDKFPQISVVVIGRNEGERLVLCLESVRAADYPGDKIELIYVDTDSKDDSCAAAENLGAKVIRIQPERPCAAAWRLPGARGGTCRALRLSTTEVEAWQTDRLTHPSSVTIRSYWVESRRHYIRCHFGFIPMLLHEALDLALQMAIWLRNRWRREPESHDKARRASAAIYHLLCS